MSKIITGISFLTATGILWVILGSVISRAAKKQLDIAFIQGISGVLMTLLLVPAGFFCQLPEWPVAVAMLLAGAGNYYIFLLMNKAMQTGPNGLIWAMIQSAFAIPFIMGIVIFSVPCSPFRLTGFFILLLAMCMMGFFGQKTTVENSGSKSCKWLFFTLCGFLLAGLNQSCANLPSYLLKNTEADFGMLAVRCGICTAGTAAGWLIHEPFRQKDYPVRNCTLEVILMIISTLGASFCLFYALDLLAGAGMGAIGYPIAMGVTIAFFQIYTAISLRERLSVPAFLSILLCLGGIILITL